MSSSTGRKFVWQLLDSSQILQLSYIQGDTHQTAFNEGKKYIGVLLFAQIQEVASDLYNLMVSENSIKLEDKKKDDSE